MGREIREDRKRDEDMTREIGRDRERQGEIEIIECER